LRQFKVSRSQLGISAARKVRESLRSGQAALLPYPRCEIACHRTPAACDASATLVPRRIGGPTSGTRKALKYRPSPARLGAAAFSRQSRLFDDFPDIYAPRSSFFALDKPWGPDHYPSGTPDPASR